ncbi:MAG: MmgE/PrpD family protein, partial [Anaerovoracaceae bacterium]
MILSSTLFACIVPAALGYAEREGGVDGTRLITAVATGLDFAIYVALAQRAPMRFFRPAMCGGLGATATLCKLAGLDEAATRDALGLAYSHLSG